MTKKLVMLSCAVALAAPQNDDGMRARRMYYQQGAEKPAATTPAPPAVKKQPSTKQVAKANPPTPVSTAHTTPDGTPVISAALRLGLRYTILDVDPANKRKPEEVDPDTEMKNGQCFAVLLQPNRGGYLYVFNAGTSGQWTLLPPSDGAQPGPIQATAYRQARVPQKDCYAIDPPSGSDRLYIVLTERAEDVKKLSEAIHSQYGNRKRQANPSTPVLTASRSYGNQIDLFRSELTSRDIRIQKVSRSESGDETRPVKGRRGR